MGILTLKIESIILQVLLRSLILLIKYWRRGEELRGLIAQFRVCIKEKQKSHRTCITVIRNPGTSGLRILKMTWNKIFSLRCRSLDTHSRVLERLLSSLCHFFCQQSFKLENYFTYAIGRDIQIRSVLVGGQSLTLPFLFHVHLPKGKCSFISISIVNSEKEGFAKFQALFFLICLIICSYFFYVAIILVYASHVMLIVFYMKYF